MSSQVKQTHNVDLLDKVFRVANEVVYICVLSIVWLIASLPLVTIPAATVGVYAVLLSHLRDGNREYLRPFGKAFTASWSSVTLPGVLCLGLVGLCGFNTYYYVKTQPTAPGWTLAVIQSLIVLAGVVALTHHLSGVALFHLRDLPGQPPTLREGISEAVARPVPSLLILAITVGVPVFFIATGLWQFSLFAVGLITYGNAWVLARKS